MLATRRDGESAREALAELCQAYWQPLYGYVRRQGYRAEEARDLTQGYFLRLLEKLLALPAGVVEPEDARQALRQLVDDGSIARILWSGAS